MPSLSRGKESWVFYDFGFTRRRNCDAALRKRQLRAALHVVHVLCRLPLEAKRSNSTPSQWQDFTRGGSRDAYAFTAQYQRAVRTREVAPRVFTRAKP